jgi:ADP-ribose pyrophosphatase YjhB (NUDIX family)
VQQIKQVFAHYVQEGPPPGGFKYCPLCATPLAPVQSGHVQRMACPSCGFLQHRNPAPTVSVLVVNGDQVLLGKRGGHPGKGTWSLPSGYVEYEDDFLSTAIREVKEETGLDVEIESIVQVMSSFVSPRFHFLGLYLAAHVLGGALQAGDDLDAVEWFPMAGPLPEMGFPEDIEAIRLYADAESAGLPVHPGCATPREPG